MLILVVLIVDECLIEFDFGKMEGMIFLVVEKEWLIIVDNFYYYFEWFDLMVVGSEFFEVVIDWFKVVVFDYCYCYLWGNVLVVFYGVVLNVGINGILGVFLVNLK